MDCAPASMSMRAMCSPSCAAWSGGAVARCFTYCEPSTEHTHASSTSSPRSNRAHEPNGTWHPPCNADRVITMRFPANELGIVSATLPAHFLQDGLRSRLDEHARHVFPQLRSLVRRGRGALLHVLRPIHGTYARLEHKLAAFYTRPRTQRHLAPTDRPLPYLSTGIQPRWPPAPPLAWKFLAKESQKSAGSIRDDPIQLWRA